MTKYENLVDKVARDDNILFLPDDSNMHPAASLKLGGDRAILFNERAFPTESERLVALAHEYGHCLADAFCRDDTYSLDYDRCENRAWRTAVTRELPLDKLLEAAEAVRADDRLDVSELAAYLGLTPEFVLRAISVYTRMGLLHDEAI
ncbi:hypothetical protein FACS1894217_11760 [Clostridia bacterium]|nr:hypothetical protein FACS1894217_11760 [Clostridia bacterium]